MKVSNIDGNDLVYTTSERGFFGFEKFTDSSGEETVLVSAENSMGDISNAYFNTDTLEVLRRVVKWSDSYPDTLELDSLDDSLLYVRQENGTYEISVEDWDDRSMVQVTVPRTELISMLEYYK